MKSQILKIKRALAGENATSLTSRMVKIQDGRMWAYGGTFCLSVPFPADFDCGFLPGPVLGFYSIPRQGEVLTVQDGTLRINAGARSIRVPCVPGNTIPVLDVLGGQESPGPDMENIRRAATFFDAQDPAAQFAGITFQEGRICSGNLRMLFMGSSGLSFKDAYLRIPAESVEALLALKQPPVSTHLDNQAIRFDFEDGTRLTSRILGDGLPKTIVKAFGDLGEAFEITEAATLEILSMPCASWEFGGGDAVHRDDSTTGTVSGVTDSQVEFKVSHKNITTLLGLSRNLSVSPKGLSVVGESFAAVVSTLRN